MLLSIIVVSYNTKNLTLQTVKSAWRDAQLSESLKDETEIIIVDNNSDDETLTALKKEYQQNKKIKLIAAKENLGFAGGNNLGLKEAQGEYLLLLNSDTVVQRGALESMVENFERLPLDDSTSTLRSERGKLDKLGILAATLLNPDGTLQPQGGDLPTLAGLFFHMTLLDDLPIIGRHLPSTQHTGYRQTERLRYHINDTRLIQRGWVAGTAMMIRRQAIEEIDLLDDNIFMYGEDVEYCLRAKKHHWDIAIDPQAKVTHYGQASSTSANAVKGEFQGFIYNWAKHKPLWQVPLVKFLTKLGIGLRALVFRLVGDDKRARIYRQLWPEF